MATSTKAVDWNLEAQRYSRWNQGDGEGQSVEDDGDEDEDEENEEDGDEEHEDLGAHQKGNTDHDAGATSIQIPDPNLVPWDKWATQGNHMPYNTLLGMNSPSQYPTTPGGSFFCGAVREPGATMSSASASHSIYGRAHSTCSFVASR